MPISRYAFSRKINVNGRTIIATSTTSSRIHRAVLFGEIKVANHILQEGQRLDTIAHEFYGIASYWWIIAAASGIGWGMQVPPGTILAIPKVLDEIYAYVG